MLSFIQYIQESKYLRGRNLNPKPTKLAKKYYKLKRPLKKTLPILRKGLKPTPFFVQRKTRRIIKKSTEKGRVYQPTQITQTRKKFSRAHTNWSNKKAVHGVQPRRFGPAAQHF